jgi:hypothetical protein
MEQARNLTDEPRMETFSIQRDAQAPPLIHPVWNQVRFYPNSMRRVLLSSRPRILRA